MNDIDLQQLLDILTPDQLRVLNEIKQTQSSKRKQNRNKKNKDNKSTGKVKKPKKVKTGNTKADKHSKIPNKGVVDRKEALTLGERPNLFLESRDIQGHKQDIQKDKVLWGDSKPTKRSKNRTIYMQAKCTKCQNLYDDVASNLCYKEGNEYIFVCDDCIRR